MHENLEGRYDKYEFEKDELENCWESK